MSKINTLLIANRGEIACRVMRTAREQGIKTIAVYSDADELAPHVRMADDAVRIGPAPVNESYLIVDNIIQAAKDTGADAIHPGYGFLSENAAFSQACADAGIIFVGPPEKAIDVMGDKARSKRAMIEAGVPCVPGYQEADQSDATLIAAAERIGYPVMVKATAGGGGRGMRLVEAPSALKDALGAARSEALNAFGDDTLILERAVIAPRHVEIQVFADSHGNVIHLGERDCSVQRRHQKVVEEAPCPVMTPELRASMGAAAVKAAKDIGYVGAGTVEFMLDSAGAFFFLEMNTRLQVEHPVTEMITGQDLVEWQLVVAAGGHLPLAQDELKITGHALEARLYAEDPHNDFLPATGPLLHLRPPQGDAGVRVDTGVVEGDSVTPFYDPMIAKLVVWDENRDAALRKMQLALANYQVAGLVTNLEFLKNVASHPAFAAKDLDTSFIDRFKDDLVPAKEFASDRHLALAAVFLATTATARNAAAATQSTDPYSPWNDVSAWRLNDVAHHDYIFAREDDEVVVSISHAVGGFELKLPSGVISASAQLLEDGSLRATLNGHMITATVVKDANRLIVISDGKQVEVTRIVKDYAGTGDEGDAGAITAPMPGKIPSTILPRPFFWNVFFPSAD